MSRIYGYARVSTAEQNLDRQIDALVNAGVLIENIITDKKSGKNFDREGYQSFKQAMGLRSGDTLIVKSLDRLGRNKKEVLHELDYWKNHNVRIKVIDIPTTMTDFPEENAWIQEMINSIIIEVYTSIAEQERKTIKARQTEGIEAAKKRGKHLGRPKNKYPDNYVENYILWKNKNITAVSAMNRTGLTRGSFYNMDKAYRKMKEEECSLQKKDIESRYLHKTIMFFADGDVCYGVVNDVLKEENGYTLYIERDTGKKCTVNLLESHLNIEDFMGN